MTKGITSLIIEMDAAVVVQLVKNIDGLAHHPFAFLINVCCALKQQFANSCTLLHIYREGNCVWFGKLELQLRLGYPLF